MVYLKNNNIEEEFDTLRYLKCLSEGMNDWIEVKAKTGNVEIKNSMKELQKEISKEHSKTLPKTVFNKMKSLGINKDTLKEFKGIFNRGKIKS